MAHQQPTTLPHLRSFHRARWLHDPLGKRFVARRRLWRSVGDWHYEASSFLYSPHQLDGPERDVRLLVDHREDLVAERTRIISRLRWHLHELDPSWQPAARSLDRPRGLNQTSARLDGHEGIVARIARDLVERLRSLNTKIAALAAEITTLVEQLAPSLVAICGCGPLTAAKILGETAGVIRFRPNDAYDRHNGTAPLPVWSSNRARHRLSRRGNRQINTAIHRIALTQAHYHPGARALIARRRANGDGGLEALRILKRRLSDIVYQALLTDAQAAIAQST